MKRIMLLSLIVLTCLHSNAQGIAITTDNTDPHTSAMLDIKSDNKGFLPPRLTEAQKKSISSPANGLIIFQTDGQKGLYIFEDSWKPLSDQLGKHQATENLRLGGYRLSNSDTTVGISIDENSAVLIKSKFQNGLPVNRFQFDPSGAITSNGKLSEGSIPETGAGARFMWYPGKAALRAGSLEESKGHLWNEDSIGLHSFAFGQNNAAAGLNSFALGSLNSSAGAGSISIGVSNQMYGQGSIGVGRMNTIHGNQAMALGRFITINGAYSFGIGTQLTTGPNALYSLVMGMDMKADHRGTVLIGDASAVSTVSSTSDNQFTSRFGGGYRLYSAGNLSAGVILSPNGNSWSILSDSTKKERFVPANGMEMLSKLRNLKMGTWNYKGMPQRHYGLMAQEFFAAYGKDQYGVIGNDTTINQADLEGVMMILIHALEERSNQQWQEIIKLKQTNHSLQERLSAAEEQTKKIDLLIALLKNNHATQALVAQLETLLPSREKSCCEK
ncbi:tail fiber domain-containing protein [Pseudoflavitalea rhizosphaerae]|uniref:tail fiber domain-containing protein n=1 Tax=Pseudoflavitalea rhizosphaerae TaxID=1884793 RepID=UPI000F8DE80D|nr:tail fiber domain-containing protein [Pseudoflavitalea rhizosphaerae]